MGYNIYSDRELADYLTLIGNAKVEDIGDLSIEHNDSFYESHINDCELLISISSVLRNLENEQITVSRDSGNFHNANTAYVEVVDNNVRIANLEDRVHNKLVNYQYTVDELSSRYVKNNIESIVDEFQQLADAALTCETLGENDTETETVALVQKEEPIGVRNGHLSAFDSALVFIAWVFMLIVIMLLTEKKGKSTVEITDDSECCDFENYDTDYYIKAINKRMETLENKRVAKAMRELKNELADSKKIKDYTISSLLKKYICDLLHNVEEYDDSIDNMTSEQQGIFEDTTEKMVSVINDLCRAIEKDKVSKLRARAIIMNATSDALSELATNRLDDEFEKISSSVKI